MKRTALLSVLLLLVTVPAIAENPRNYATLKLGAYLPQADDMDNFNDGFNVEVAVGQYINPNVAVDLSFGYLKSNGSAPGVSGQVRAFPALLSIKGVLPVSSAELYVLVGGGVYFTDAQVSALGITDSVSDITSGFQAGVGGNINLSGNVFLGFEGKYFWSYPEFDSIKVHIDGIQATANIGYRF
jgi:opacity protein-like surface antigen